MRPSRISKWMAMCAFMMEPAARVPIATASVPVQTGASYFWSVAGGAIASGQGTNALTFTVMPVPGGMATVACIVTLNGLSAEGQADVSLT